MVLDISPSDILQEHDLSHLESTLWACAADLAVLGAVDSSRELLSMLGREGALTEQYGWGKSGLVFAWRETGHSPEGLSSEGAEQALEKARDSYESNWNGVEEPDRTFD